VPGAKLPTGLSGCWLAIFSSAPICLLRNGWVSGDTKYHRPVREGVRQRFARSSESPFGVAAFDQLLHLFRLVEANGNMFL
jgi:hypothetical protein